MALSNAERQARYKQRLKERAAAGDIVAAVRSTLMHAVNIAWKIGKRPNLADFDDWNSVEEYLAFLSAPKRRAIVSNELHDLFSAMLDNADEEQSAILREAIALLDAVNLRGV